MKLTRINETLRKLILEKAVSFSVKCYNVLRCLRSMDRDWHLATSNLSWAALETSLCQESELCLHLVGMINSAGNIYIGFLCF